MSLSQATTFPVVLPSVLVIDDDRPTLNLLAAILVKAGYEVEEAQSIREARECFKKKQFPIVLCDINLGSENGLELLAPSEERPNKPIFIFITGDANIKTAVSAMAKGAFEYLTKPNNVDELERELLLTVKRAAKRLVVDTNSIHMFNSELHAIPPVKRIIGKSSKMLGVYRGVANAALHQGNVLILGETGTGKEQIARAIHTLSPWAEKPFVAVNCGALVDTLLESELFGHVKGSFTGAHQNKRGLFEEASGGTLFLDEIGDISLALQIKLLRTLQEKEIKPVGSSETRKINVRVIAATNRNLEQAIKEGSFREDLYFRLKGFLVEIPPLRERSDDLPELIDYFVQEAQFKFEKKILGVANEVSQLLRTYSWPGNVRELENAVMRAVVSARSEILYPEDFPVEILNTAEVVQASAEDITVSKASNSQQVPLTLAEIEREYILKTLERVNHRKLKAAEILGIDRVTLYRKIARYGILVPE